MKTLMLLAASCTLAIGATDFSGDWRLSVEKSMLPEQFAGMQQSRTIRHSEPQLHVATQIKTHDGQNQSIETRFTTDGKTSENKYFGAPMQSTVKWDGNALVFDSKISGDMEDIQLHDRWTLSSDSMTLTIERTQTGHGDEPIRMRFVFEKQKS